MGSQPSGYQQNHGCVNCRLCNSQRRENSVHIMFECPGLELYRGALWNSVLLHMPEAMKMHVCSMNDTNKLNLLLSCYNESYIVEWNDLYKATAKFVHDMYYHRSEAYKNIT